MEEDVLELSLDPQLGFKQTETGRLILQYDWGKGWGGGITESTASRLPDNGGEELRMAVFGLL